eukprot:364429-Chlamydomonas_euryale.AAC.27
MGLKAMRTVTPKLGIRSGNAVAAATATTSFVPVGWGYGLWGRAAAFAWSAARRPTPARPMRSSRAQALYP